MKTVDLAKAVEEAKKLDQKYNFFTTIASANGSGIPIVAKDNICTKDIETTAGSEVLKGYKPTFDATVISRLKAAGGKVIGKNTMDEFGFGTFATNTYKIPKNPLDEERSCGGSSGGSAGYVAASKLVDFAVSESTGGSISCPAAFCGVVGLTPTYGLVSRYGLIDYASSLDKIGVVSKTVKDSAEVLSIISGYDGKDSTCLETKKQKYESFVGKNIKGMKIGVPKEYFEGVDEKVSKKVWDGIKKLEKLGAKVVDISLPLTKAALSAYYIIATAEASTNLAKFCGLRYGLHLDLKGNFNEYFSEVRSAGFGEEAKRRVMLGTFVRMAGYRDQYYLKALKVRRLLIEEFEKTFSKVDVVASPTMPVIAPKFSEIKKLTPLENYLMDILTVPANLAGLPHLSVPCGEVNGMPVGLQFIGEHFQEAEIIQAGSAYEQG